MKPLSHAELRRLVRGSMGVEFRQFRRAPGAYIREKASSLIWCGFIAFLAGWHIGHSQGLSLGLSNQILMKEVPSGGSQL